VRVPQGEGRVALGTSGRVLRHGGNGRAGSQGTISRMLAQGDPVLEKSWSLCRGHRPLALGCCCRVLAWGHKRRGSCLFRTTRSQAKELFFHRTQRPSSCAPQGSGPSTLAEGLWESTRTSGSTGPDEVRAPLLWSRGKPRL